MFTFKKQSLAYVLIVLMHTTGYTSVTYTMDNEQDKTEQTILEQQRILKTFSEWKKNTQLLQSYAQTTAQLIINNKFVGIKENQKNKIVSWINDCITIIDQTIAMHPQPTTLQELMPYMHRMVMLSDIFSYALKTSFNKINLSPYELLPNETITEAETPAIIPITKIIPFNEQFITNLTIIEAQLKTAGYSTLNRICNNIRSVNKQFHITQCVKYSLLITAVAIVCLSTIKEKQPLNSTCYTDSFKRIFLNKQCAATAPISQSLIQKITQKAVHISKIIMNNTVLPIVHKAKTIDIIQASTTVPMGYLALEKMGFSLERCNEAYIQYKKRLSDYLLGITDTIQESNTFQNHPRLNDPIFAELTNQTQPLNDLLAFLKDPALYIRTGIRIPKALLFTGASGNGKTFTIKAFCASVNAMYEENGSKNRLQCIETDITELLSWGENGLKKIIEQAKAQAPCVVFIDEIHLLRLQQESNFKLLTDFLIILDDLSKNADPDKQIIFIAATNRPDNLDAALMRPGRFDLIIQCDYPTEKQRLHTFTTLCQKAAVNPKNLDLEKLTQLTHGCTFSMLNTIFNTASYQAKKNMRGITDSDLYQAFCFHVRHIIAGCSLNKAEKEHIAAYQAGCIVASYLLDLPFFVEAATIQQYTQAPGETWSFIKANPQTMYAKQYGACFTLVKTIMQTCNARPDKNQCYYYLAGNYSERLLAGSNTQYGQKDTQKVIDMICLQNHAYIPPVAKDTMTNPTFTKEQVDEAIHIKNEYEKDIATILAPYKNQLVQIQQLLINKLYITKADIDPILASISSQPK